MRFKNWARVLLLYLLTVNLIIIPFEELIRNYVMPIWSTYFATYLLVFKMGYDDPWVTFNYWAGFLLRISLSVGIVFCLTRSKIKERFR
jgi:hypothetical protein